MKNAKSAALLFALGLIWLPGCSVNLSRFDVIGQADSAGKDARQITRAETADQGSGTVSRVYGPGGHTLSRVTVGGTYLRRAGTQSPASRVTAGLHGNPRATQ